MRVPKVFMISVKDIFQEEKASLVLLREARPPLVDFRRGILPLWEALKSDNWCGAAMADKVVGKGAAYLAVAAGISFLYTPTLSRGGQEVLTAGGVPYEATELIPYIENRDKTGLCPFEEALQDVGSLDIEKAMDIIAAVLKKLNP